MNAREILSHIEILQILQGDSTSISSIADSCSLSRSAVRRFVHDCEDWDLVHRSDGYTLTAAGEVILREYDNLDNEEQAGLASLSSLEKGFDILRAIADHPLDKAELAKKSGASRSTVHRFFNNFSEWIDEQNGYISLSPAGGEIMEEYKAFRRKINIIEAKTEFLKRYEDENIEVGIPLIALAQSRQVVSTMGDRQKVVREVNDMGADDIEPLRGLSHSFSSQISDESYADLSPETDAELIVDRSVYKVITNPRRWKYLFMSHHYPNFRILVLPDNVTIALGINGSKEAVIATYSEKHPLHVGLFSENEVFIKWVSELYEHFRANANPIPKDLIKWAVGR